MSFVRTVTGDRDPATLGAIDYHEHLFHRSPLLPGEDLDDEDASRAEFTAFLRNGFDGIIDATPIGLGRDPAALARIAQATGGVIIASTGRHRDAHYPGGWIVDDTMLAAIFLRELTVAMAIDDGAVISGSAPEIYDAPATGTGPLSAIHPRAGLIKLGIDYWSISRDEAAALHAAASVHAQTGAPVMVHTEYASAGHELLDLLESAGVPSNRVALAHVDRNPDPALHADLASRGAYLGYDGAARYRDWPESAILDCLAAVAGAGHLGRLLLGGDVARRSRFTALGGMPGLAYLGTRFRPRMVAALGEEAVKVVLVDNPSTYLTWAEG